MGMGTINVDEVEFRQLLNERDALAKQRDELQAELTAKTNGSLYRQVRAFHAKFGHSIRHVPTIPSDDEVRFRLRLLAEEFFELLDAAMPDSHELPDLRDNVRNLIEDGPVAVDLPEFVDALGDVAYLVEGASAAFGVIMKPVMDEIQRANLSKEANNALGKPTKPPGWRPPDILGILRAQGWK